jgi:hypothetical protein
MVVFVVRRPFPEALRTRCPLASVLAPNGACGRPISPKSRARRCVPWAGSHASPLATQRTVALPPASAGAGTGTRCARSGGNEDGSAFGQRPRRAQKKPGTRPRRERWEATADSPRIKDASSGQSAGLAPHADGSARPPPFLAPGLASPWSEIVARARDASPRPLAAGAASGSGLPSREDDASGNARGAGVEVPPRGRAEGARN